MRVIELCVYALIIIAAIIWMLVGGKLYIPPGYEPPAITQATPIEEALPPVIVPKGEVFPGQ
jgi:hypothetical protein